MNFFNTKNIVLFTRGRSNGICAHENLIFITFIDKIVQNNLLQIPCIAGAVFNIRDLIIIPCHVTRRDPQIYSFIVCVSYQSAFSRSEFAASYFIKFSI